MKQLRLLYQLSRRRMFFKIVGILLSLSLCLGLVLFALRQNISLFVTPSEIVKKNWSQPGKIRLGGVVQKGSIQKCINEPGVIFRLTDFKHEIAVIYHGILPDLFREGQGIVTLGQLTSTHQFLAQEVLAKHSENYVPPDLKSLTSNKK